MACCPNSLRQIALLLGGLAFFLPMSALGQSNARFAPAKIKQVRKINKSYTKCKKEALANFKAKKINKKAFAVELNNCQESFPGAVLFTQCKSKALKGGKATRKELAACRRFVKATSFDAKADHPFFLFDNSLYFAGIGFNQDVQATTLALPNFDCDPIKGHLEEPAKSQFILFGNHPRTFESLTPLRGPKLMSTLNLSKPAGKDGTYIPGFGQIFGDPRDTSGVVFFPTSACNFDGQLGDIYAGLSAYYLLDENSGIVSPYFAIAYYKPTQTKVKTAALQKKILEMLGDQFQVYPKDDAVKFFAEVPVTETDSEKDPKNLCRKPRPHKWVAVLQSNKDAPEKPGYLILANVKNLCDYGDKSAKRLL